MLAMDAFDAKAFETVSLTASLLDAAHVPRRIGELGIFEADGMETTDLAIERQESTIVLVKTTPRNSPAVQVGDDARHVHKIPTSRIALEGSVTADEVQNVRAFGSESNLQTLVGRVNRKNLKLSNSIGATEEYQKLHATKGLVKDADGTTLFDPFTLFGVVAQTEVDFDLDNASPVSGALRKKCASVIRKVQDELGDLPYAGIHGMCSSQFFDDLIAHPEVRETVKNFPAALQLRESGVGRGGNGQPVMQLQFGGITWEEYRGSVGGTKYVEDNKAHIFPIGVPELFLTRYAPAEFWDTVNTTGLPRYARQFPDPHNPDSKRILRVQTQVIHLCTRPRVLIPAKRT